MRFSKGVLPILLFGTILIISCSSGDAPTEAPSVNNPPDVPSNPTPADSATNVTFNPTLTWTCTDPDGDPLVYDVHFGTSPVPPIVSNDLAGSEYSLQGLLETTTYYWKIAAKDPGGLTTEGPVWSFTTAELSSDQISSFGSLPKWSPNGQKLLFGGEGLTSGLWLYDRILGTVEQIIDDAFPHRWDYAWSAGSDQIAFGGAGPTSTNLAGIFIVALDGSDPVQWHPTGYSPCWIPDGSGLVFSEEDAQSGTYGLFKLIFADSSLTQLTASGIDAEFNPAGTRIAYREPGASQAYALKIIDSSGGQMTTVVNNCLHFQWTTSGETLIYDYMSYSLGMVICTVPASGGIQTTIKTGASEPSVSSTDLIAYQGLNVDLSLGIYVMNLDGSNPNQVSPVGAQPSITPDGTLIAYTYANSIWLVIP